MIETWLAIWLVWLAQLLVIRRIRLESVAVGGRHAAGTDDRGVVPPELATDPALAGAAVTEIS